MGVRAPGGQAGRPAALGNPSGSLAAETRCQRGSCRGPQASQQGGRLRVKLSLPGCKEKELRWVLSARASWAAIQGPCHSPVPGAQSNHLTHPVAHQPHPYRTIGLKIPPGQSQHHSQPHCPLECLRTQEAGGPPPARTITDYNTGARKDKLRSAGHSLLLLTTLTRYSRT